MLITQAEKNDLQEILELQYLAYQSEAERLNNYDIPPLKQKLSEVEAEFRSSVILKALDKNGSIVGSVRGRVDNDTLYVGKLIVRPNMQGQGIGTSLLSEIEKVCPHDRCELFTSSRSEKNITLYKRNGYVVFKEQKVSDNLNYVYLEKVK